MYEWDRCYCGERETQIVCEKGWCCRYEGEAQTVREWELSYCGEREAQTECEGVGAIVMRGRDRQTQCV